VGAGDGTPVGNEVFPRAETPASVRKYGATMATLELIAREANERDNNRSPAAERLDRLDEMLSRYLGPTVIRAMADDDVTEVYVNPQDGAIRLDTRSRGKIASGTMIDAHRVEMFLTRSPRGWASPSPAIARASRPNSRPRRSPAAASRASSHRSRPAPRSTFASRRQWSTPSTIM